MIGVVDTSALIRLFIPDGPLPEGFDDFLRGVERSLNTALGPELLLAETANVVNKKRKSGELSKEESEQLLADLLSMPIRLFPHRPLLPRALELAGEHNLTVYDTLYLALAEDRGAVLYSADQRLLKAAAQLRVMP
ncbi:MAG: type II toxin-antitoxin system VapC family toxin [Deltaproteobacteria bacterium]|nr:type II toxin-antitoxin system VapC family toxin [Deltaproteobacteria bacterium]MBW1925290.1 type II toxin-antitoxin system VapC family toxin [Deltaproteobacteria bacterium]MBW1949987.1 type II toxin-antitoxin system VapC family toxin [Deltaproteobacteria bacterium]MBW2102248.1 type II toxin-antitoxin system VapC family toxin [Deltaproteobacteria bacterium]